MSRDVAVVIVAAVVFAVVLAAGARLLRPSYRGTGIAAAAWLARGLIAAGAAVMALRLYEAGRAVHLAAQNTSAGIDVPSTVSVQLSEALFEGGVLIALGALVYLLAGLAGRDDGA